MEVAFGSEFLSGGGAGRPVEADDGKPLPVKVELVPSIVERQSNIARGDAGFSAGTITVVLPPSFSAAGPDWQFAFVNRNPEMISGAVNASVKSETTTPIDIDYGSRYESVCHKKQICGGKLTVSCPPAAMLASLAESENRASGNFPNRT